MGSKKKYLIILRGFPGAGKTQVAKRIVEKLSKQGRDAFFWNLDSFAPDAEEDRFWAGLHEAIKHQYVIAEMYSGRWHSSDPERWIKHFREEYEIHSFLLEISIESGFRNYNDPRHGGTSLDFPQYKDLCERFLKKEGEKEFSLRAKICEEIHKDSESSNWDSIVTKKIIAALKKSESILTLKSRLEKETELINDDLTNLKTEIEKADLKLKEKNEILSLARRLDSTGLEVEGLEILRDTIVKISSKHGIKTREALERFKKDILKNYDISLGLAPRVAELEARKLSLQKECKTMREDISREQHKSGETPYHHHNGNQENESGIRFLSGASRKSE